MNLICDDNFELVSRDMLNLAFLTIFSRRKNYNSKISNVGCKNITFQLPDAEKIETPTALSFLEIMSKVEPLYRLWCLGGTFFSMLTGVN